LSRQSVPSAEELYDGKPERVNVLLHELLEAHVLWPARRRASLTLSWLQSVLRLYDRPLLCVDDGRDDGGGAASGAQWRGLWAEVAGAGCMHLVLALHYYFGSRGRGRGSVCVDLARVYVDPASEDQRASNTAYALTLLAAAGVGATLDAGELNGGRPDDDVMLLQVDLAFTRLRDMGSALSTVSLEDAAVSGDAAVVRDEHGNVRVVGVQFRDPAMPVPDALTASPRVSSPSRTSNSNSSTPTPQAPPEAAEPTSVTSTAAAPPLPPAPRSLLRPPSTPYRGSRLDTPSQVRPPPPPPPSQQQQQRTQREVSPQAQRSRPRQPRSATASSRSVSPSSSPSPSPRSDRQRGGGGAAGSASASARSLAAPAAADDVAGGGSSALRQSAARQRVGDSPTASPRNGGSRSRGGVGGGSGAGAGNGTRGAGGGRGGSRVDRDGLSDAEPTPHTSRQRAGNSHQVSDDMRDVVDCACRCWWSLLHLQ
jgi:hypothetical protein